MAWAFWMLIGPSEIVAAIAAAITILWSLYEDISVVFTFPIPWIKIVSLATLLSTSKRKSISWTDFKRFDSLFSNLWIPEIFEHPFAAQARIARTGNKSGQSVISNEKGMIFWLLVKSGNLEESCYGVLCNDCM